MQLAIRRASLAKVIGVEADAAPERVLDRILQMAGSKSNADATKLLQVRKAVGAQAWDEVASAALARMGRSPASPEFSGDKFSTAYRSLSDQGRQILFGSTGKQALGQNVKDIATISDAEKVLSRFANRSKTGTVLGPIGVLAGGVTAPLKAIPAAGLAYGVARNLAAPLNTPARAAAQRAAFNQALMRRLRCLRRKSRGATPLRPAALECWPRP